MNRTISPTEFQGFESQSVELKKSLSAWDAALKALCGMVNAESGEGKVWFGVAPDGGVCGLQENLDSAQQNLAERIGREFEPKLNPQIEVFDCERKRLICLSAKRQRATPYHEYSGRAWIREGSRTHLLSLHEKQRLTKSRDRALHNGPWKCDRCGSSVGMLATLLVTDQGARKTYTCQCGGDFWPAV